MERVKANGSWTLMCPDECPGLSDVYGKEFVELYEKYELEGKGRQTVLARDLWFQVLDAQMETGTPYLLFKDAANQKSNQKNIGTIKSSNLCCEIIEYSGANETAVCNLASIALPSFISKNEEGKNYFDYEKLHHITKIVTENLNRIIDVNYYPTEKTKTSNLRHRPIGIGVQGLADVFLLLDYAFSSEESKKINRDIFETIYHAALEKSCELAVKEGVYETFPGSPASQGILQFDMWNIDPGLERYNWTEMKLRIQEKGLRNSLLLAPMPTASTSQILGYNECIEPITSNIYSRRTLAGEFIMVNKYLMNDLIALDLWNETLKNNIIANNGSIQHLEIIPQHIREKFRTVWEIPMRTLIDMSADRGVFICQSQSLNLWLEDPNYNTLTSMHFYTWSKGLKTGIYYLRRRPKHQAQQFTIEPEKARKNTEDICEMCSA
jgi:ribonucleoside-diphosphate reductase alpha chain